MSWYERRSRTKVTFWGLLGGGELADPRNSTSKILRGGLNFLEFVFRIREVLNTQRVPDQVDLVGSVCYATVG